MAEVLDQSRVPPHNLNHIVGFSWGQFNIVPIEYGGQRCG